MKNASLFVLLVLIVQILIAQEQTEDKGDFTSSNELLLQGSTLPEIKIGFIKRFNFPFLQGESPLTKDNNIGLTMTAEISPVSLNGIVETVWTPVAFFQWALGGRIGSGWVIELFDKKIYGIGLNEDDATGYAKHNGRAFDGLLWKAQTGAALQGDLAAVFPGEWNHLIARSYHEISYRGYTRAEKYESWYFENGDGENCNGFNYYGNFLVGYQMPIFMNMTAFLTEMNLQLYDMPNIMRWTFSSLFMFTITKQISLTVIAQCRTQRNYEGTNWKELYYRNRNINSSNPIRIEFYRVAAVLSYKF